MNQSDSHNFKTIVSDHRSKVLAMAARFARNHHELDDIAQTVFIKVWKGLSSFRGEVPLEHWISKITVRACYDHLRRHRKERERLVSLNSVLLPLVPDETEERARQAREASEILQRSMVKLPSEDQLVLTLYELEGYSTSEIAALTGWSVSKVKVRLHRARKKLRTNLELDGYPTETHDAE